MREVLENASSMGSMSFFSAGISSSLPFRSALAYARPSSHLPIMSLSEGSLFFAFSSCLICSSSLAFISRYFSLPSFWFTIVCLADLRLNENMQSAHDVRLKTYRQSEQFVDIQSSKQR